MSIPRDAHGQPPRALYAARVQPRELSEMLGICKGLVCDGVVNDAECVALAQWIRAHPDVVVGFPGNLVHERLSQIFADGIVDEDERADLFELLNSLVGEPEDQSGNMAQATRLGFDDPVPTVFFDGRTFCLTGQFATGTRSRCEQAITDRGGRCLKYVTKATDYLIVGAFASDAWVHATHGRKFEEALNFRAEGARIAIVAEEHWRRAIDYDA